MTKRFLNVEYSVYKTRINVTDMEDLSEVRRAIKDEYGPVLADVGAAQLQLYDQQGQHIKDLDDIPEEYYKKAKDGGLSLVVHTLQPNQQQTSSAGVSIPSK